VRITLSKWRAGEELAEFLRRGERLVERTGHYSLEAKSRDISSPLTGPTRGAATTTGQITDRRGFAPRSVGAE
jgi:hypothetical protein